MQVITCMVLRTNIMMLIRQKKKTYCDAPAYSQLYIQIFQLLGLIHIGNFGPFKYTVKSHGKQLITFTDKFKNPKKQSRDIYQGFKYMTWIGWFCHRNVHQKRISYE